jgi:hypothetical protein
MKKIIDFLANIPKDKLLHAYCGSIICLFLISILHYIPIKWYFIVSISIAITFIIALFKELYDTRHQGSVELWDVLATVIGAIIISVLSLPLII